jgi:CHASE3 domain sensor protein
VLGGKKMKNLKISMKLAVSFSIMILLILIIGIASVISLIAMRKDAEDLYKHNLISVGVIGDLREEFGLQRSEIRNVLLNEGNNKMINTIFESIDESKTRVT